MLNQLWKIEYASSSTECSTLHVCVDLNNFSFDGFYRFGRHLEISFTSRRMLYKNATKFSRIE